ncbi:MAG: hypothetical protein NTV71_05805 [Candidatus Omnitrophica bacterium]|nr:hypothetical protein [Candidatus Omnitrophota bacterium]
MNTSYYSRVLMAVVAALLVTSVPLHASVKAENAKVVQVSGKISEIDVKLGKLQLELDASKDRKDPTKYNINKNDTRVVDPRDKKFLKLEDLRVGQHVKIEFNYIQGELGMEPVAQKIIAESMSEPIIQEASGELKSIDVQSGTFTIKEKPGTGNLSYFVYEPKDIIVMQNPSMEPVRLVLKPSDLVKVEFVVKSGNRYARSITLYPASSVTASTTTVTTTSTTVIQ